MPRKTIKQNAIHQKQKWTKKNGGRQFRPISTIKHESFSYIFLVVDADVGRISIFNLIKCLLSAILSSTTQHTIHTTNYRSTSIKIFRLNSHGIKNENKVNWWGINNSANKFIRFLRSSNSIWWCVRMKTMKLSSEHLSKHIISIGLCHSHIATLCSSPL